MLDRDRRARPTAARARRHRWFSAGAGPLSRACAPEGRACREAAGCGRAVLLEELVTGGRRAHSV
eukprot:2816601-Pyramimonas_sp.AAC.1